jgi:hypothetical protein
VKWLRDLWTRPWRRSVLTPADQFSPECMQEAVELSALAGLERKLDVLTRGGAAGASFGQRAEVEVERFFGGEAVRGIRSAAGNSEADTTVFAADRLLVTFLGRSAAMAITRKLYADPK